jgi:hypothetical protein
MDPLTLAALISGGATILGGLFGSNAANKAADTQEKVARDALELNKAQIAQARLDATPWMDAGKKALAQYQGELGMGPANFQSQFTETPGYKYQVQEAEKGAVNNLAALGMKNSGAALKALTKVRSGLANQEYNNYTSKISGLAGVGQNQVNQTNAMTQNSVLNQGQLMQDAGAARASGYAGAANSWIGGMNSFANNMGSMLGNYNQDWQRV